MTIAEISQEVEVGARLLLHWPNKQRVDAIPSKNTLMQRRAGGGDSEGIRFNSGLLPGRPQHSRADVYEWPRRSTSRLRGRGGIHAAGFQLCSYAIPESEADGDHAGGHYLVVQEGLGLVGQDLAGLQ